MEMDQNKPAEVKVASTERRNTLSPEWYRATPPTICPDCGEAAARDSHFCWSCRSFLRDRWVGRLASPKRRFMAAFLDGTFKDDGALGLLFWNAILPTGAARGVLMAMSVVYGISALYLWTRGTTPGKKVLGMRVITADGMPAGFFRMALRETIGKTISTLVFGLGLLSIPADKERQGWHDKMFGTWVVHEDES